MKKQKNGLIDVFSSSKYAEYLFHFSEIDFFYREGVDPPPSKKSCFVVVDFS